MKHKTLIIIQKNENLMRIKVIMLKEKRKKQTLYNLHKSRDLPLSNELKINPTENPLERNSFKMRS